MSCGPQLFFSENIIAYSYSHILNTRCKGSSRSFGRIWPQPGWVDLWDHSSSVCDTCTMHLWP